MAANKKPRELKFPEDYPDFNDMVDVLAGDALMQLIRGLNWRSIMWQFAQGVTQWANMHRANTHLPYFAQKKGKGNVK